MDIPLPAIARIFGILAALKRMFKDVWLAHKSSISAFFWGGSYSNMFGLLRLL